MAYHNHPHPQHPHPPPPAHFQEAGPQGQLVKIVCKAEKTYNLAVRNGVPVVVPANSEDPSQFWIKDTSFGERTKDNYGFPAFILVNKGTRQVLKHGKEKGKQLEVVDHRPGYVDEDLLFTESQDFGEGFTTVRAASDTSLNMTVFHEEEKKSLFHHGDKTPQVVDGATVVLDVWHKIDRQYWKIFPLS